MVSYESKDEDGSYIFSKYVKNFLKNDDFTFYSFTTPKNTALDNPDRVTHLVISWDENKY